MTKVDAASMQGDARQWRGLLLTGAWSALASVVLIVVQMVVYLVWPPPRTTQGYFELLLANPVHGLLSLDLLLIVSNTLAYLIYLALGVMLWRVSRSAVVIALAFCVVGIAAYMAAPRPVEMLNLAHTYAHADAATRAALLATGDGMLATWAGTAFDVYYFFNLVTLLILAILMLRSSIFGRATAVWGLVGAAFMIVPTNFGPVGLAFGIASLLPWGVFAALVGWRMLKLAGPAPAPPAGPESGHLVG